MKFNKKAKFNVGQVALDALVSHLLGIPQGRVRHLEEQAARQAFMNMHNKEVVLNRVTGEMRRVLRC